MRIVHVVRQYVPSVGGLEEVVSRLAREQQRLGHDVKVVTLNSLFSARRHRLLAKETIDGVRVERFGWRGSTRYPICPQVIAHVRDADLVHVHAVDFFFDWLSAMRWFHRRPMVASTHGGFFHTAFASTLKKLWFTTVTRLSASGYRCIVATSENDGEVFSRIARRVTVIENGVDIDRYRSAASPVVVPVILYFGRWSANKGLPELIDLVAALRKFDDSWRLIVAGRPYDLTVLDLTAHAAAAGLADAIELHPSPSDATLRGLVGRASYYGCLSRHEGFGIAAIEALSAGLIPVLGDIAPFRKIVEEARCGLLVRPGRSLPEVAREIMQLNFANVGKPVSERTRREQFTNRYDWSSVVACYEDVYRTILTNDGLHP